MNHPTTPLAPLTAPRGPRAIHPVNIAHLVFGLVFLGIAGSWALGASGAVDPEDSAWLFPLILVIAGAAGLVASLAKGLSKERAEITEE
jgi:hypothetical protein